MSNAKEPYSRASSDYIQNQVPNSSVDQDRYNRSKEREALYNENWKKQKVNLNDLVDKYAPDAVPKNHGTKMEWKGPEYTIVADKVNGSARIKVNGTKMYLDVNGNPSYNKESTHFKIKTLEEM